MDRFLWDLWDPGAPGRLTPKKHCVSEVSDAVAQKSFRLITTFSARLSRRSPSEHVRIDLANLFRHRLMPELVREPSPPCFAKPLPERRIAG